jgi:ABC-type nitrate/sulfonate/bicarbonate transport system substrate-binding protein
MRSGPAGAKIVSRREPSRRSRAASAGIAAAVLIMVAAGCQASGTGASSAGLTRSSITVAAQPGVDDAPLYMAIHNGLFAKAGLTVHVQTYSSAANEISALASGSADIAIGDYADFFFAHRRGFTIVADAYDAAPSVMEVLTLPGSGITKPPQLQGKTIGTPEPQGIPFSTRLPYSEETLATQSVLTNDGVNVANVGWKALPADQLVSALQNHQVDAILATEPTIYQAEIQLGASQVIDSCSGQTASLPLSGYFALGSFAQKYRATVLAFRSALLDAQSQASQAAQVQAVLASDEHMGTQTASLVTLGQYPTSVKASNIQRVASLMSSFNLLNPPLDVAQMIFH